jgi:crotonobetainyl-CoA:carnitine CoA-transferase CaiB-like acyl-CoA transferase
MTTMSTAAHAATPPAPASREADAGDGPLAGVRVLDLGTVYAAPITAMLLGDYGADVLKIEHPRGDPARTRGPSKDGHGLWWKVIARNKRTATLVLSRPEGREIMERLVADADVLIENFRPGVMEQWGLGPERLLEINPRHAVMLALYHRDANGAGGQVIDLSLLAPLLGVLGPGPSAYDQLGIVPGRHGNRSPNNAPRNETGDGRWVAISASATSVAARVMAVVGRPDIAQQEWFSSARERVRHADDLDEVVGRLDRSTRLRRRHGGLPGGRRGDRPDLRRRAAGRRSARPRDRHDHERRR